MANKRKHPTYKIAMEFLAKPCAVCGFHDIYFMHLDHIVPVCKGGTNDRANLQSLCMWCNYRKGGRLMSNEELAASIKAKPPKRIIRYPWEDKFKG